MHSKIVTTNFNRMVFREQVDDSSFIFQFTKFPEFHKRISRENKFDRSWKFLTVKSVLNSDYNIFFVNTNQCDPAINSATLSCSFFREGMWRYTM
jgi:hypothetical protein